MIIIYDFDGTLTPYSSPQYPIIKKLGYTDLKFKERVKEAALDCRNFYEAFYKTYRKILEENNIEMTRENICLGAKETKFNKGVLEYFNKFRNEKTGIKHYIVTSGIKCYVEESPISIFVDEVYGVTFKEENGILSDIVFLLTDKKKVDVIKEIRGKNKKEDQIIYIGDGPTDFFAFEYVHSIGGKTVFIKLNEYSNEVYKKINKNNIIDECFNADFSNESELNKFIQKQLI